MIKQTDTTYQINGLVDNYLMQVIWLLCTSNVAVSVRFGSS